LFLKEKRLISVNTCVNQNIKKYLVLLLRLFINFFPVFSFVS